MREKLYLEKYWITIENDLGIGYGVTAYNETDAINILSKALNNKPSILSMTWMRTMFYLKYLILL